MCEELNNIGFAELVITGGRYIWWGRRELTRGEQALNIPRTSMAIVTLIMNYSRARKKPEAKGGLVVSTGWYG